MQEKNEIYFILPAKKSLSFCNSVIIKRLHCPFPFPFHLFLLSTFDF